MIYGIVLTHGNLGEAFVKTAERIIGPVKDLSNLSSTGMSPKDLKMNLEKMVHTDDEKNSACLIFVGLKGGHPWHVACRIARERPNVSVISGVNLPMLLSFLVKRENLALGELLQQLETDAHRGIDIFTGGR
ncbi:MAG: hypothetical protein GXO76_01220 [Calditrichaeota bacterium]|nr:hypothetical protein [Calditrichota bacterium]